MRTTRTILAALSVLALAGIASNASALSKNFLPSGKDENAKYGKVLDECKGAICVKVRSEYGYVRIKLRVPSPRQVEFFYVRFRDDITGKFVTRRVEPEDLQSADLEGLTAQSGRRHTFMVKTCFKGRCSNERKFSFTA